MENGISDEAVLRLLGERLLQYRLNLNITQKSLAKEAGVSVRTINRVEQGHSTQLSNFLRVLRSLGLLDNLEALVPEPAISPMQQIKLQGKSRKRASTAELKKESDRWTWGDEEA
ncbi:helix-turn-helix transcriptional regulator [Kiloniella sp.]|uniref:helix-turn-helix transcriptional regulator n=1 Tax=Kiloniella sp. TaxID=1938587 RepID=UPI003A90461F